MERLGQCNLARVQAVLPAVHMLSGAGFPYGPPGGSANLPASRTCSQDGTVFLWITNREKLWRFVRDELLPAWGLRHAATWVGSGAQSMCGSPFVAELCTCVGRQQQWRHIVGLLEVAAWYAGRACSRSMA